MFGRVKGKEDINVLGDKKKDDQLKEAIEVFVFCEREVVVLTTMTNLWDYVWRGRY